MSHAKRLSVGKLLTVVAVFAAAMAVGACSRGGEEGAPRPVKIGFIVKMPEQAWFINEHKAAEAAGREMGFSVVRIAGPDGAQVMTAIDNLAAQGAQGFVICAPDVHLGPAIMARARSANLKVISVDDQLIGSDGKPIADVPHLGMSGYNIGRQVGSALVAEMKHRGWDMADVGAIRLTNNELPTAKERTDGATQSLTEAGFPEAHIFDAPQRSTDTESGLTAASPILAKNAAIQHWIIFALNEESVLGGVRATEQFKVPAGDVIGLGINGSGAAFAEFSKSEPTGFFGTVAVSSTRHGRDTAIALVRWIRDGVQPAAYTETTGTLMTRDNWQQVRADLGL
ncbi:arabinose ABC transporter substrate-binding protein [Hydrocarboniphaga sp.]|uniref:arabinose ABC transporter substrate-binding protein n=1 Tax=Hydrocarboniphaga sp. TaxID=2033016 RepID=UPI003D0C65A4